VSRSTDTRILEDAAAYIDDRAGADPEELEPDEMPSSDSDEQFTYRGKVVTKPSGTASDSGPDGTTTATPTTDGGATDSTPAPSPDERVCQGCGEQLDADVNFCPTCGEEISAPDPADTTESEATAASPDDDPTDSAGDEGDTSEEDASTDTVMYRGREVDASYLK
jgi:hypothetical protein